LKGDVIKKTDIEKEENFRKEIMDLLKSYEWKLEDPDDLSLEDPSGVIRVITNFRAGTGRLYPEIKRFEDKLANILKKYGLKIRIFESDDKTISNDLRYRRIDITISN
jgi:hypothetical protein